MSKPYGELIDSNPYIDKTLIVHCLTEWIYLAKTSLFDEIVDLHFHGRRCCALPLEKHRGNKDINHQNYFDFGSLLGIFCQVSDLPVLSCQPNVYIPVTVIKRIDTLLLPSPYIVFHCQSRSRSRDWVTDKWRELAQEIVEKLGLPIVEVGERSIINCLRGGSYIDLSGRLSILETAEVIRRARMFVGVDSGPAHLANAVGTYGVILFGEYHTFKKYLPYTGGYANGENAELIYADGLTVDIPVDRVYEAVERKVQPPRAIRCYQQ